MNSELNERYRKFDEERMKVSKPETKKSVKKETGSIWTKKIVVNENSFMKYNAEADAYLKSLYESVGAITAEQKYNTIILTLGYQNNVINFSHNPTWEQKCAMMEYDLLEQKGLIQLTYA